MQEIELIKENELQQEMEAFYNFVQDDKSITGNLELNDLKKAFIAGSKFRHQFEIERRDSGFYGRMASKLNQENKRLMDHIDVLCGVIRQPSDDDEWLKDFKENHDKEISIKDGKSLIGGINALMWDGKWEELNDVLKIPHEDSSVDSFVFLLRSTFSQRFRLPHWEKLRDVAVIGIEKKGRNPKSALSGLF